MKSGDLDREITIERMAEDGGDNALGEKIEGFSLFISTRAKRTDVRDSEKVAAGQVQGSIMARFVIRSWPESRAIDTHDRLKHDSEIWQIHGVKELSADRRHGFLEITASTRNG